MAISSINSSTAAQPASSATRPKKTGEDNSGEDHSSVVTISAKAKSLSRSAESSQKRLHQAEAAASKAASETEQKQGQAQQTEYRKSINTYA